MIQQPCDGNVRQHCDKEKKCRWYKNTQLSFKRKWGCPANGDWPGSSHCPSDTRTSSDLLPQQKEYRITEGELMEIFDHFKRQPNPLIAKRMGGIISNISSRPIGTKRFSEEDFINLSNFIGDLQMKYGEVSNCLINEIKDKINEISGSQP